MTLPSNLVFNPIQAILEEGIEGDADAMDIVDAQAKLVMDTMGYLGIVAAYGRAPKSIKTINWPIVTHYFETPAADIRASDRGGVLVGGLYEAGGVDEFHYKTRTCIMIGEGGDVQQLQEEAMKWLLPFHLAYAQNQTLGGLVRNITTGKRPTFQTVPIGAYKPFSLVLYHDVWAYYKIPYKA